MSNLHFFKSHPHYFHRGRQQNEDTLIVATLAVVVVLLIAGMIYSNTGRSNATSAVSTLSPLPPLIENIPAYDAGQ